jgi:cobalt-zinc-cadmium efflux system membrane fusion protein
MRGSDKSIFPAILIVGLLSGLVCVIPGCSSDPARDAHNGHGHNALAGGSEAEDHHGHGGHDEKGEEGGHTLSLEEIVGITCEHDVAAYQCAACRYEVGVVKVPPSLLKDTSSEGGGLVVTRRVTKQKVTEGLNVTGEVQLNENAAIHISPRVPGIIESVQVDIGARVQKNEALLSIRSVELGKALSDYDQSRALTALSEKNLERERSLFKRKIGSEQDMIEAQMTYEQHKTQLRAAEQTLHVLGLTEEDLAAIKKGTRSIDTGGLPVRAPIDGTIIEKHAVVGELVASGHSVMLLVDLHTVWVWADIYEQDLAHLLQTRKQGTIPVQVFVQAFPGQPFEGEIDYIGATMEERTRTVKVRATVRNADRLLRPGMFCEIRICIGATEEALAVPKAALLSDEGHDFVFLHWKEDYYVRRPVTKGRDFFEGVEILEGLAPGQTVVTDGAFLLKSDVLREKMGAGCAD